MKIAIILAILFIFIAGCSTTQNVNQQSDQNNTVPVQAPSPNESQAINTAISGTADLVLNTQDLQKLGMKLAGEGCHTEEGYGNIADSTEGQYTFCNYTIDSLNNTWVVVELQKFATFDVLNGTYLYDSSHLYSAKGLLGKDTYGDHSIFRVNNENDYGGQYNPPGIYFYHLWITKDLYLIHITSMGGEDAKDYIEDMAQEILSKFG